MHNDKHFSPARQVDPQQIDPQQISLALQSDFFEHFEQEDFTKIPTKSTNINQSPRYSFIVTEINWDSSDQHNRWNEKMSCTQRFEFHLIYLKSILGFVPLQRLHDQIRARKCSPKNGPRSVDNLEYQQISCDVILAYFFRNNASLWRYCSNVLKQTARIENGTRLTNFRGSLGTKLSMKMKVIWGKTQWSEQNNHIIQIAKSSRLWPRPRTLHLPCFCVSSLRDCEQFANICHSW